MPAASSRAHGSRNRRLVNDINVVPYIDVMLVLLVIFMVTAPLLPPSAIELPTAGRSTKQTEKYIEVQVFPDGSLGIRTAGTGDPSERRIVRADLEGSVRGLLAEHGEGGSLPVVISGDRAVRYERVIEVEWGRSKAGESAMYPVDVAVEAADRQGLLRDISEVFAKEKMNVVGVQTQSVKGTAWMTFTVEIADSAKLAKVLVLVADVAGVRSARRR